MASQTRRVEAFTQLVSPGVQSCGSHAIHAAPERGVANEAQRGALETRRTPRRARHTRVVPTGTLGPTGHVVVAVHAVVQVHCTHLARTLPRLSTDATASTSRATTSVVEVHLDVEVDLDAH